METHGERNAVFDAAIRCHPSSQAADGKTVSGKQFVLITAITSIVVVVLYFWVDMPIMAFFQSHKHDSYNEFFKLVTNLGRAVYYLVPAGVLFLYFRIKNPLRAKKAAFLFVAIALSGLITDVIKPIMGRARPKLLFNDQIYGFDFFRLDHEYFSFPSGHSTTALSAATVFALLFPRYRWLFFLGGVCVAVSRMAVVAHFPGDVVAGSVVGICTSLILHDKLFKVDRNRA
jgi:membrane-associated phospholipid phosphatase